MLTRRALIGGGLAAGAALALVPRRSSGGTAASGGRAGANLAAAAPDRPGPTIVSRAAWGADEQRRQQAIDFDPTVEKIVLHHTGIDDGSGDWAGQVRDIYEFETAGGYRDIAYHFLVDPSGQIYEGRWARAYPAGTEPDGQDGRGWSVRGGHARGHNPRTIGIALLGDYTRAEPSDAALGALVDLFAWKCDRWRLDPQAESPYVLVSGEARTLPTIVSHGQVRATECPGPNLERVVPELRARTAAALARDPAPTRGS